MSIHKSGTLAASLLLAACSLAAAPLVPYRAWQFHVLKPAYVSQTLKLAKNYDVNTVVFSHEMIGYASQLFDGTDRGEKLRQLANQAHAQNLRVWIWVREFQDVPDRFLENRVVQLDRPGFWDWLASRYEEVFTKYPEFDGVILTFHETQYKVFDPKQVASAALDARPVCQDDQHHRAGVREIRQGFHRAVVSVRTAGNGVVQGGLC